MRRQAKAHLEGDVKVCRLGTYFKYKLLKRPYIQIQVFENTLRASGVSSTWVKGFDQSKSKVGIDYRSSTPTTIDEWAGIDSTRPPNLLVQV